MLKQSKGRPREITVIYAIWELMETNTLNVRLGSREYWLKSAGNIPEICS